MGQEFTIPVAFLAGIVSFIAPCVLPLIPGFLAYLAGVSVKDSGSRRWDVFLNSLFFVLGFSFVFAVIGIILRVFLAGMSFEIQTWLARIGGALIIFFGIYLLGLISIPFLEREHKIEVKTRFGSRYLTSFVVGAAFAAGWTPCVGAVLGGILGLAAAQPGTAFALMMAYSLGLGIPFLIMGLFIDKAQKWIRSCARYLVYVRFFFGIILIALGILIFTQRLDLILNFEILNNFLLPTS